eukprot:403338604
MKLFLNEIKVGPQQFFVEFSHDGRKQRSREAYLFSDPSNKTRGPATSRYYCRGICETLCQRDHVVLSMSIFHYVFL